MTSTALSAFTNTSRNSHTVELIDHNFGFVVRCTALRTYTAITCLWWCISYNIIVAFHSIGAFFLLSSASLLRFLVIASFKCAFRSKHTFSCEREEFLLCFDAAATNLFDSMNCDEDVGFVICKIIIPIQRSLRIDFYVKRLAQLFPVHRFGAREKIERNINQLNSI